MKLQKVGVLTVIFLTFNSQAMEPVASKFLEEKIGQLIFAASLCNPVKKKDCNKEFAAQQAYQLEKECIHSLIKNKKIGGVIFLGNLSYVKLRKTIEEYKKINPELFFGLDRQKSSLGVQFPNLDFPSAMMLAAISDATVIEKAANYTGKALNLFGINIYLTPFENANNDPENPFYMHSFGDDPAKVAQFTAAYNKGLSDAGILSCLSYSTIDSSALPTADLLVLPVNVVDGAIKKIITAVQDKKITEEEINSKIDKVVTLKNEAKKNQKKMEIGAFLDMLIDALRFKDEIYRCAITVAKDTLKNFKDEIVCDLIYRAKIEDYQRVQKLLQKEYETNKINGRKTIAVLYGSPYAIDYIAPYADKIIVAYEDTDVIKNAVSRVLCGFKSRGILPIKTTMSGV